MSKSLLARMPTPVKVGVPVAAAGLLAAACGTAAASGSSGSQSSSPQSSAPQSSAPQASGSTTGTVITAHAGSGGTFLTVGSRTVYLWAADGMNKSNCMGACAGAWPPVMAHGKVTVANGAKASDIGTIASAGGGKQVTYNGHPLYFFAGDSSPDQTAGQGNDGFGAKWWLVNPSGGKITAADTATAAAATAPKAPTSAGASSSSGGSSAGGSWG